MSYIIKSTSPFVSIKLTEKGRENLAKGQLNFGFWAIGDSEINYDREAIVDANQTNPTLSGSSRVFRPFDRQPNIKSFITNSTGNNLNTITPANISVVKAVVNNMATERGFFSANTLTTMTGDTYMNGLTSVSNLNITGGTTLYVSSAVTVNVGNFIRLKVIHNETTSGATILENNFAVPNLWYKVQATATTVSGTAITVDRNLPNMSNQTGSSFVYVYRGGEVADSFGYDTSTAYWDSGTLSFDSATNITCDDVKVWNMNNVWCENLAGVTGLTTTNLFEDYTKFGSYDYLGTKNPYLDYLCSTDLETPAVECNGIGFSYLDTVSKSISILHYTNNTISNLYGEFFYIDSLNNKTLSITIPDLMYHRVNTGTTQGVIMGMKFTASGTSKVLTNTDIQYYDLYEDPAYVTTPQVVGKVFPQLKMVVIDDDEIIAAMSYKSNRNWTLPPLSAQLISSTGGTSNGLLDINKTMYITYALDNMSGTGLTPTLPCQTYIKVTNTTSSSKDVGFKISDIDLLPYMRKKEDISYDGLGFYATNFKVIYQIVDNINDRPDPGAWKVYDFTSTGLTTNVGETIGPLLLENQNPYSTSICDGQTGFILSNAINSASTIYDITIPLSMAPNTNLDKLQFGDERFFYGNLSTYIGATIFKTIFDIRLNSSDFNRTTNPTRSLLPSNNPSDIKVTEVGIYDTNGDMVVIGKLSQPVPLKTGNTIMLELSMDF
jgi:hypothetical protein